MALPYLFTDADGVLQGRELTWADARAVPVRVQRPGLDLTLPLVVSDELSRRVEQFPAEVHLLTYWCEQNAFDDIVEQAVGAKFPNRVVAPFPAWGTCGVHHPSHDQFAAAALAHGRVSDAPPVACAITTAGCGLSHAPEPRDIRTAHRYISDPHWKPRYIAETLRRDPRPFVWLDDEEVPVYAPVLLAEFGHLPHLVIGPDTAVGLTETDVQAVERFLSIYL